MKNMHGATKGHLVAEIKRVKHAMEVSKSEYLRRDYARYLFRLRKELKCRQVQ